MNKQTSFGVNFSTQDIRGGEQTNKIEDIEIDLEKLFQNNIHFAMLLLYDFESKEIHNIELNLMINNQFFDDSKPDTNQNGFLYGVI